MNLRIDPALQPRRDLIDGFVVHTAVLEGLVARLAGAAPGSSPQHVLVIGAAGMGKTTLLHRLAYHVQDEAELDWLPILFPEAQYNVGALADVWLNALRGLSVATADGAYRQLAATLARSHTGDALEEAAKRALTDAATALGRRLLLLVDRFGDLLDRIGDDVQQARLREVLQHEPRMMLVATASQAIEATYAYDRPLYAQLAVQELRPLDPPSTHRLFEALARLDDRKDLIADLQAHAPRLDKLNLMADGNLATLTQLYARWRRDPEGDTGSHLEALLDGRTPTYKGRMQRLGRQTQRVLDALAQGWQAATATELADALRLNRSPVSTQLIRLAERGLVERIDLGQRAVGYQIRERFLNLWLLMRGDRRGRQRLRWFTQWLDRFYPAAPKAPDRTEPVPLPALDDLPVDRAGAVLRSVARTRRGAGLLEAARLAHELRDRVPASWRAHAAVATAEARLGRGPQATSALGRVLRHLPDPAPPEADIGQLCLEVARVAPGPALQILQTTDYALRLLPLADALQIRTRTPPDHGSRLPRERRAVADDVLSQLEATEGP